MMKSTQAFCKKEKAMIDFDEMREWIKKQPARDFSIRRARLYMFDLWRYCEDYDKIIQMVEELKGE